MSSSKRRPRVGTTLAGTVLLTALSAVPAVAGSYSVFYAFTGGADGAIPRNNVVADAAGNLYTTTSSDGHECSTSRTGCGAVVRIDTAGVAHTLTLFNGTNGDGGGVLALVGSRLFGTLGYGGATSPTLGMGRGVVYYLNTDGTGYTVLHTFYGTDGSYPSSLQPAPDGSGYGTTQTGGPGFSATTAGDGVLFRVLRDGTYVQQHAFTGGANDGQNPNYIAISASGTIFGSTGYGGTCIYSSIGCGLIYSYTPSSGAFRILKVFKGGGDGSSPNLGGIAADGSLYGSTTGSNAGYGTLFKMTQNPTGGFTFSTLYTFSGHADGGTPGSPPTVNPDGSLSGTTMDGGSAPSGTGGTLYTYVNGTLTTLKSFDIDANGGEPEAAPYRTPSGTLYGTASAGGIIPCPHPTSYFYSGCGVMYRYSP